MIQNHVYGCEVDIWALGVLLFEIVEGVAPFRGSTAPEVLAEMKKDLYFSTKFSDDEIDLVRSILRVNPKNRPTLKMILQHRYFTTVAKKDSITSTCASEVESKLELPSRLNITVKEHSRPRDERKNKTYIKADNPLSPKTSPVDSPLVLVRRNDRQPVFEKGTLGMSYIEPFAPKISFSKQHK